MPDNQDQFSPPPPPQQPSPGPPDLGAPMPPPPPPPVSMPVMLPSPLPKKTLVSRIKDALVLIVFFGSLVLNLLLIIALGAQGLDAGVRETLLLDGARDQQIAVIDVKGMITDELAGQLWPQFKRVRDNKDYRALLLYVNSPGGGVTASDTIAHYVNQIKAADKPVVVFMGSVAASGGYYVSAGADYIMAGPTTTTGSIGVLAVIPNIHGTLEKIGAHVTVIRSTPATRKALGLPFEPWDSVKREYFQKRIDPLHKRFVDVVHKGRQEHFPDISVLQKLADGAALTAAQAKAAKLIDQDDAYFEDAMDKAAELAKLDKPKVVRLSKPPSLRETLTGAAKAQNTLINIDASFLDDLTTPRLLYLWQGQ
ncbi:MAG: signal peptide peptidase SppA [Phycisphaerae bacterium]|nr:signal peptide peptidase SppA [Phycisphaerae bacterium]